MPKEGNGTFLIILIDILFCVLILWATFDVLKPDRYNPELNQGLISDDPIESSEENDSFGRKDYAKSIVSEMRKTVNKRAFNIAITGAWGSGKTSFLNLIKGEMDKGLAHDEKENHEKIKFITVKYNPWDFKEDKIIGLDLLKTISHELANEKELQEKFKGLMVSLQGVDESPWYKVIPYFLSGFSKEKSIDEYRKEIGSILGLKGQKLVIFLDDLDRLDGDEILEVFKTIRNSFDIANTFFILGFDIDYVADQIKENVKGGNGKVRAIEYLDKIFQMRLNMPSIIGYDFMRKIEDETNNRIDTGVFKLLPELFNKITYRDTISIINGIKIFDNATENDHDFNFTAKVLLQILSLKYPNLYDFMAYNYEKIVIEEHTNKIYSFEIKVPWYNLLILFERDTHVEFEGLNKIESKIILTILFYLAPNRITNNIPQIEYYRYFKFRTPDTLISKTGLFYAISGLDESFIKKHLGSSKEDNLLYNLELLAKDYLTLDGDQVDFIIKGLIKLHSNKIPDFKSITDYKINFLNIFDSSLRSKEIYTIKSFSEYIHDTELNSKLFFSTLYWYLDTEKTNQEIEAIFDFFIRNKIEDIGYLYYFVFRAMNIYSSDPNTESLRNNLLTKIKQKVLENFSTNPVGIIKPFVFALSNGEGGFSYYDLLGSAESIKEQLDLEEEKQIELHRWLSSGPFIDNKNHHIFYKLEYASVFGEEYDSTSTIYMNVEY